MSDPVAESSPARTRRFKFTEFFRPRIVIGLTVWMLLLHAFALALIAWFAAASYDSMLAQVAADAAGGDNSVSPEWRCLHWSTLAHAILFGYLFGFAPVVTLLVGASLIVLGMTVRGGADGKVWAAGGALAGACTGLSYLYLSIQMLAILGQAVSRKDLAGIWSYAIATQFNWPTLSSVVVITLGMILGMTSALILRRIALGGSGESWQVAGDSGIDTASGNTLLEGVSGRAVLVANPNASRLMIAFLAWTALVQAIPVFLCAWRGLTQAARHGPDSAASSPLALALWDASLFYSICAVPSLIITAAVGAGLVVVAFNAHLRRAAWPWFIGGVIAGAVMGRAWLCMALSMLGLATDSNLWGGILLFPARILLLIPSDGYIPMMAIGAVYGVICTRVFRRILLGPIVYYR